MTAFSDQLREAARLMRREGEVLRQAALAHDAMARYLDDLADTHDVSFKPILECRAHLQVVPKGTIYELPVGRPD